MARRASGAKLAAELRALELAAELRALELAAGQRVPPRADDDDVS